MVARLDTDQAAAFNLAVAKAAKKRGAPLLPWPQVAEGEEVRVGKFEVMFITKEKTLSILGSSLFAGNFLNLLAGIVSSKPGKKKTKH